MRIGKVIGTVTLSRSHPSLAGASYRVVVPLSLDNLSGQTPADAEPLVVYDDLGAGLGSTDRLQRRGRSGPAVLSPTQADRRLQRRPARRIQLDNRTIEYEHLTCNPFPSRNS